MDDSDYPAALRELPDGPLLLYVRGSMPQGVLRVAVVGSRRATLYGRRVATGLGSGLAARGVEVVSGGALGIDTAAHGGALAEEGATVAVLGSGLARPYPEENADLFDRIAGSGAVVSEFPLEAEPKSEYFPRRNRVVSGLSAAVVVVEAAARSGALITAGLALDQGREVMAVPGPVSSPVSEGSNRLIQQGAKLVQNIEDILDELPPLFRAAAGPDPASEEGPAGADPPDLGDDERTVACMLDAVEPLQLDDLADRAPFGIARLQAALFGLEIRGMVEQRPGKYYLLRPRQEYKRTWGQA
jgi:DNA processing protein